MKRRAIVSLNDIMQRLGEILASILQSIGAATIRLDRSTFSKLRDSKADYLQWLAVLLLTGKVVLCREEGRSNIVYEKFGVKLMYGRGEEPYNTSALWYTHADKCEQNITGEAVQRLRREAVALSRNLMFVIDLSFWNEHTEIEKNELIEQIVLTIKTVRNYLYDYSLALTSVNEEFLTYFENATRGMRYDVLITRESLRNFIKKLFRFNRNAKIAVLDPEGDNILTDIDVKSYNVYILGGIIDKERVDKFGTFRLYNLHRLWEFNIPRFKIALDGSVIGVPDRINKIVNIILMTLFDGYSLRDAIVSQQSKRDRIYRWHYEIQKHSKKVLTDGKVRNIVTRAFIDELMRKYPLDEKSIERVLKSLNVVIVD